MNFIRINHRDTVRGDSQEQRSVMLHATPDQGWAWVILAGSFFWTFLFGGLSKCFGFLFVEFLDLYEEGPEWTSWIMATYSLCVTTLCVAGGVLADRFPLRLLVLLAAPVATLGMLTAAWAPTLSVCIVGYGIVLGIPMALINAGLVSCASRYFHKRSALANGIAFSGGSIASMVLPSILVSLIEEYTIRGALTVLSGIVLNLAVVGAVIRPVKNAVAEPKLKEERSTNKKQRGSCCQTMASFVATVKELAMNFQFVQQVFFFFCCLFGLYNSLAFIPPYAQELGLTKDQESLLVTVSGVCDLVGRLIFGYIGDLRAKWRRYIAVTAQLITGVCGVCVTFYPLYPSIMCYCATLGLLGSTFLIYAGPFLVQILGVKRVGMSLGICTTTVGVATSIGPPLYGKLKMSTGSYGSGMRVGAAAFILGALVFAVDSNPCHRQTKTQDGCETILKRDNQNLSHPEVVLDNFLGSAYHEYKSPLTTA